MEIGNTILNTTHKVQEDYDLFKTYTTQKQIIIIASAVCIGFATKEVITNIMNEIILPFLTSIGTYTLFQFALNNVHNKFIYIIIKKTGLLIWFIFSWLIIIFIVYLFLTKFIQINPLAFDLSVINTGTKFIFRS